MRRSVSGGDSHSWWHFVSGRIRSVDCRFTSGAPALATATILVAIASFAMTAPAVADNARDDSFSALRAYVQSIGNSINASGTAGQVSERDDGLYAALRAFTQGEVKSAAVGSAVKLAAAEPDNLLDWLRSRQSGETPNASPPRAPRHEAPIINATVVGSTVCLGCHASVNEQFGYTLMGRLLKQGKMQCETCHGPGSEHVRQGGGRGVGGIISFRPNDDSRTPEENNAICLGCHERGNRTLWHGSIHQTRGLSCTNCHTIMKEVSRKHQLKTADQPDTCFQCHKDIRAKFARSQHMPLPEGKMECTNCHNPHGSYNDHLLKEATVNDVCFQCHAEKRGPFLWEHPPVVENCLNCHDPHGTINENLLKVSRPRLCQRCHNAATRHPANPRNPVSAFAFNRGCVNCHSQIHGSNNPGGQFFHR